MGTSGCRQEVAMAGEGRDLPLLEIVVVFALSVITSALLRYFLTGRVIKIKRFIWRGLMIHHALGLVHEMLEAFIIFGLLRFGAKFIPLGLISFEECEKVHIFIFVFGVAHVFLCSLTICLAVMKIRSWKDWEDAIQDVEENVPEKVPYLNEEDLRRLMGSSIHLRIQNFLSSCAKHFYGPLIKIEYIRMRHKFITENGKNHYQFDFCEYIVDTLQAQFEELEGTSLGIRILVMVFLWFSLHGWIVCFGLAFVPLILLVVVGAKLDHSMTLLSNGATQHELFYFGQTRLGMDLIRTIICHIGFVIAFLFWVLAKYGFEFRLKGQRWFIVPGILASIASHILCSCRTFPLYVIFIQVVTSKVQNFTDQPWEVIKRSVSLGWKFTDWPRKVIKRISDRPREVIKRIVGLGRKFTDRPWKVIKRLVRGAMRAR